MKNDVSGRQWLKQHAPQLADVPDDGGQVLLANEKGSRRQAIGGTKDSKGTDAKAMVFEADMLEAAQAILDHPGWTSQTYKLIWAALVQHYGEDGDLRAIAAKQVGCSKSTVGLAINQGKKLMLTPIPEDQLAAKREADSDLDWEDENLEKSIALGCQNAHRAIVQVYKRKQLTEHDVDINAVAVRTLIASRESERKYLELLRHRREPAPEDDVRALAGRERV